MKLREAIDTIRRLNQDNLALAARVVLLEKFVRVYDKVRGLGWSSELMDCELELENLRKLIGEVGE